MKHFHLHLAILYTIVWLCEICQLALGFSCQSKATSNKILSLVLSRNWPLCSVVFVSEALSGIGCVCDSVVCSVCVSFVSYCDPALCLWWLEANQALLFSVLAIDRSHVLLDPVTHWPCLASALSFSLLASISPQFRWTLAFPPPSTAHHSISFMIRSPTNTPPG